MKRKQLSASDLAAQVVYLPLRRDLIGVRLSELDVGCVVSSRRGERGTYVERDGCFDILILAHC